ncbi:unnamed protein product [Dovyalis caffra]|uniref:Secreted protein n=1 Tax=Dovyalis caffra TaxID=77055 RepID=A0AAV1SNN1_9ROSI|nr:unnamed protein product [Dovyalis caffra]
MATTAGEILGLDWFAIQLSNSFWFAPGFLTRRTVAKRFLHQVSIRLNQMLLGLSRCACACVCLRLRVTGTLHEDCPRGMWSCQVNSAR